jgi:hypothetical protein
VPASSVLLSGGLIFHISNAAKLGVLTCSFLHWKLSEPDEPVPSHNTLEVALNILKTHEAAALTLEMVAHCC